MASRLENVKYAYRIVSSRYPPFDGAGAYRWGSRWVSPGRQVVHAAKPMRLQSSRTSCTGRVPRCRATWYAFRSQSRAMSRRNWLMRSIRRCYSPTTTARRDALATTGTIAEIPPYCGFHPSCLRTNPTPCAVNCTRTSHGLSWVSPPLLGSMPACRTEGDAYGKSGPRDNRDRRAVQKWSPGGDRDDRPGRASCRGDPGSFSGGGGDVERAPAQDRYRDAAPHRFG